MNRKQPQTVQEAFEMISKLQRTREAFDNDPMTHAYHAPSGSRKRGAEAGPDRSRPS